MAFIQTLTVETSDEKGLVRILEEWHRDQQGVAPGYQGTRVLAAQGRPGHYVIEVDFTSEDEAKQNNDRPETKAWAEKLRSLTDGEPDYRDYTLAYATDPR